MITDTKMRLPFTCIAAALALVLTTGCGSDKSSNKNDKRAKAPTIQTDTALQSRLRHFAAKPRCKGNFGLHVVDLTAGKTLIADHADMAQPSASCLKLLTGVAGLHLLGTRYKYATAIYTTGRTEGDTLHGDIAFQGSLDPQIKAPDLKMFIDEVRRKGIRHFDGRLIVDLVIKDPVKSETHWYPWDLSFSDYGLFYKGSDRITNELKKAFRSQGIAVADSQIVLGRVPSHSDCIFRFYRSVDRVIRRMWKNSSNTQATALLYTIGHHVDPKASPTEAGVKYLRKFLREDIGMTSRQLVIHDGCGLCTHNHLSPRALTAILTYGYRHEPVFKALMQNLSISGVDGTLRRMPQEMKGRIHGKTGTLSHPYGISSLAGFCKGADGHLLAFAIMDSEMSVLDAHVLQRDLCRVLTDDVRAR